MSGTMVEALAYIAALFADDEPMLDHRAERSVPVGPNSTPNHAA